MEARNTQRGGVAHRGGHLLLSGTLAQRLQQSVDALLRTVEQEQIAESGFSVPYTPMAKAIGNGGLQLGECAIQDRDQIYGMAPRVALLLTRTSSNAADDTAEHQFGTA